MSTIPVNTSTADNTTVFSNITTDDNTTAEHNNGGPQPIFKDPFPMHSLLWKLGIIFFTSGLLILCTFMFIIALKFTRRKMMAKCRRRRSTRGPFAYENQQNVMDNESDAGTPCDDHVTTTAKADSRGHVRRRSRDEDSPTDLEDSDTIPRIHKLDKARLAFQDDSGNYTAYNATRDNMKI